MAARTRAWGYTTVQDEDFQPNYEWKEEEGGGGGQVLCLFIFLVSFTARLQLIPNDCFGLTSQCSKSVRIRMCGSLEDDVKGTSFPPLIISFLILKKQRKAQKRRPDSLATESDEGCKKRKESLLISENAPLKTLEKNKEKSATFAAAGTEEKWKHDFNIVEDIKGEPLEDLVPLPRAEICSLDMTRPNNSNEIIPVGEPSSAIMQTEFVSPTLSEEAPAPRRNPSRPRQCPSKFQDYVAYTVSLRGSVEDIKVISALNGKVKDVKIVAAASAWKDCVPWKPSEERQPMANMGVAALAFVALGAFIAHSYRSPGNFKD
ncbi:hypothetical protein SADUNF_Sadunf10G0191000 [Salix dunnii]|uniref:Uncharacterized protein n=1 Tax=Salix dunnii TaxID=1413687 RepID=A0A835JUX6_9ROSI|nr:hypothetical protein SADUNF_Sadunf10G0191000 [Salix dunnii]